MGSEGMGKIEIGKSKKIWFVGRWSEINTLKIMKGSEYDLGNKYIRKHKVSYLVEI